MATPKRNHQQRKSRHLREQFDSRLPIEYRYPKRNSMTSSTAAPRQGSLLSKSSSSGYSSSGSTSSITTVVNGSKPYRPKREDLNIRRKETIKEKQVPDEKIEAASVANKVTVEEVPEEVITKNRACCIECREKEIRQEVDLESHQYANLQSVQKPQDPYAFLMTTVLSSLQRDDGGRKVAKVQQKIEKVLRMKPRDPFNIENKIIFDRQISTFASDVTIRLRAVCEVAPDTYREISAKFCEALHQGNSNSTSLKSIVKGVKSLLNF
uniref:Uncharacterized protein n=1 Tax=Caenorhabditis brenneri TaxID=135651 RepID=B6VBH1_CAEBE|nr:hypothetical protein Cbre_JD09.008 [Caenorhabditis brenneri]